MLCISLSATFSWTSPNFPPLDVNEECLNGDVEMYPTSLMDCGFLITSIECTNPGYLICIESLVPSPACWNLYEIIAEAQTLNLSGESFCFTVDDISPGGITITQTCGELDECTQHYDNIECENNCAPLDLDFSIDSCEALFEFENDFATPEHPIVITFGDDSPAVQTTNSSITHQYPSSGGIYEVCFTYVLEIIQQNDTFFVLNSCCFDVEIPRCDTITCDSIDITWDLCPGVGPDTCCRRFTFNAPFPHNSYNWTIFEGIEELFSGTTVDPELDYVFTGEGPYDICVETVLAGDTLECCEEFLFPPCYCCMDAGFELDSTPHSCLKAEWVMTPICPDSGITRHVWIFSDGTVFHGHTPPPHIFTNFDFSTGEICITHQVYCNGVLQDEETQCRTQYPGAHLGIAGETINMSDVLDNITGDPTVYQFLTDMATAGTDVFIDGLLFVDIDVSFTYGVWNMGFESGILVDQHEFNLVYTQIISAARENAIFSSCCRWSGIDVVEGSDMTWNGAFVHDADTMLTLLPGSIDLTIMDMVDCYFETNVVGIYWADHHGIFTNFHNNHFVNPADCNELVCGCCYTTAIILDEVSHGVTFPLTNVAKNEIRGYNHGIYAYNTDLDIKNFHIHELRESTIAIGGNGIHVYKDNDARVRLRMDYMLFQEMKRAVRAEGFGSGRLVIEAQADNPPPSSSITIEDVHFGYDIETHNSTRLFSSSILYNDIEAGGGNYNAGIQAVAVGSSQNSLSIQHNLINVNDDDPSLGIVLTSTAPSTQVGRVYHNTVNAASTTDPGAGIYVEDWLGTHIVDNTVTVSNPKTGIEINDGGFNLIACNTVDDGDFGLQLFESTENDVIGNAFLYQDISTRITGDCAGSGTTELMRNSFVGSIGVSNEYIAGSWTGKQDHEEYNSWLFQIYPEVELGASIDDVNNEFWAPMGSAAGTIHHPYANYTSVIDPTHGTSSPGDTCYSFFDNESPSSVTDPSINARAYIYLLDSTSILDSMTDAEASTFNQGLIQLLDDLPVLRDSFTRLEQYYQELESTWPGKSSRAYSSIKSAVYNLEQNLFSLEPDMWIIDDLHIQHDSVENLLRLTADETRRRTLNVLSNQLLSLVRMKTSELSSNFYSFTNDYLNELGVASQVIQNLIPSKEFEFKEKLVLEALLLSALNERLSLSTVSELSEIANACYQSYGRSIYGAQSILISEKRDYVTIQHCPVEIHMPIPSERIQEETISKYDVNLSPNPTKDELIIEITHNDNHEDWSAEIVQPNGVVLKNYQNLGDVISKIDVSDLISGFYFLRIRIGDKYLWRRFVVNR